MEEPVVNMGLCCILEGEKFLFSNSCFAAFTKASIGLAPGPGWVDEESASNFKILEWLADLAGEGLDSLCFLSSLVVEFDFFNAAELVESELAVVFARLARLDVDFEWAWLCLERGLEWILECLVNSSDLEKRLKHPG